MRNKTGTMKRIVTMFIAVNAMGGLFLAFACPRIAEILRARASDHAIRNQLSEAISLYTCAIWFARRPLSEYQGRGDLYFRTGQWDKAIADQTKVIQLDPNDGDYYYIRAGIYLAKGDSEKATADADKALEIINRSATLPPGLRSANTGAYSKVDILTLRGDAHAMVGAYAEAEADFAEVLTVGATDPVASNAAAWFYATCPAAEVRNGKQAVLLAKKACGLTGWKAHYALDTLAAAEAELAEWDEAMKYESQAITILSRLGNDDRSLKEYKSRLAIFQQRKPYRDEKRK